MIVYNYTCHTYPQKIRRENGMQEKSIQSKELLLWAFDVRVFFCPFFNSWNVVCLCFLMTIKNRQLYRIHLWPSAATAVMCSAWSDRKQVKLSVDFGRISILKLFNEGRPYLLVGNVIVTICFYRHNLHARNCRATREAPRELFPTKASLQISSLF